VGAGLPQSLWCHTLAVSPRRSAASAGLLQAPGRAAEELPWGPEGSPGARWHDCWADGHVVTADAAIINVRVEEMTLGVAGLLRKGYFQAAFCMPP
jgi:hypothetical protein